MPRPLTSNVPFPFVAGLEPETAEQIRRNFEEIGRQSTSLYVVAADGSGNFLNVKAAIAGTSGTAELFVKGVVTDIGDVSIPAGRVIILTGGTWFFDSVNTGLSNRGELHVLGGAIAWSGNGGQDVRLTTFAASDAAVTRLNFTTSLFIMSVGSLTNPVNDVTSSVTCSGPVVLAGTTVNNYNVTTTNALTMHGQLSIQSAIGGTLSWSAGWGSINMTLTGTAGNVHTLNLTISKSVINGSANGVNAFVINLTATSAVNTVFWRNVIVNDSGTGNLINTVGSAPPTGPAGGGLGGTYPSPTVTPAAGLDTTALHTGVGAGGSLAGTLPSPTFSGRDSSVDKINQDMLPALLGGDAGSAGVTVLPTPSTGGGGPPTGAASGSLSGTYPGPTLAGRDNSVDKINQDLLPALLGGDAGSAGVTVTPALVTTDRNLLPSLLGGDAGSTGVNTIPTPVVPIKDLLPAILGGDPHGISVITSTFPKADFSQSFLMMGT